MDKGIKQMNIITTTGYGTTGSSVVTDLLKEFSCVESKGENEFRFLFDIHGVREVEVALFQLNNRQNSDYYIKAFKNYIDYLDKSITTKYYKDSFNGKFKKISYDFINSIIDVKWQGYWHRDIMDDNIVRKFFYYFERFIQKKILKEKDTSARFYKKEMYYANPVSHEEFIKKVKNYINKLIKAMNIKKEFIALDQLVPPENTNKFLKYFDNLKIIIVDRDPRDHYLLEKYEYKESWVPFQDVKTYVKWYKLSRSHRMKEIIDKNNVMFVNFEDFIYDYEKTIDKVISFCGIDKFQWLQKGKYFNPKISIKNTKKWLFYPQTKEDIDYIEKYLSEYLYNYEV
jgi:hypothetical protein